MSAFTDRLYRTWVIAQGRQALGDQPGAVWWAGLSESERAHWCRAAGSAAPVDAWHAFRRLQAWRAAKGHSPLPPGDRVRGAHGAPSRRHGGAQLPGGPGGRSPHAGESPLGRGRDACGHGTGRPVSPVKREGVSTGAGQRQEVPGAL